MEAASGSLFCFVNTNEITKMLFSFFPNYHSLSILNTVFSFFFNKHINFAAENVKSSLVKGEANRAKEATVDVTT